MEMKNRTYTVRSLKNQKKNLQTLSFEGDLSLKNSMALYKKVNSVKITADHVKIHLDKIEKMDVTFIQLFYALKAKLEGEGVTVEVASSLPVELESIVRNAGFRDILCKP